MQDIKIVLKQILQIISLPLEQQDSTIAGIVDLINEYTLIRLLEGLDREKQYEFKELIAGKENRRDFILSFIKKYYATSAVEKTVKDEAKKLVCDYLHGIAPMISEEQKQEIRKLVEGCF